MVLTSSGGHQSSTHPTGILSCVMLRRHTSTRNTGHRTIPVLVFVTGRCCSYRRKITSMCTRTMFWASYRQMVSGRSTDGQGQSKVSIPPGNVVCGKVMFSVVSVYQFVREGVPIQSPSPSTLFPPSISPGPGPDPRYLSVQGLGPRYPFLCKALAPDCSLCMALAQTPSYVRPYPQKPLPV